MKTLTLSLFLFIGSIAFSQDIIYKDGLYLKQEVAYTGKHILYFANVTLK